MKTVCSHGIIWCNSVGIKWDKMMCSCENHSSKPIIVYFCEYFPYSQAFSLMSADYHAYAHISRQSRGVVASTCAFLAYMSAHQVENIYKDGLYTTNSITKSTGILKLSTATVLFCFRSNISTKSD